jgi:hypothetical protein
MNAHSPPTEQDHFNAARQYQEFYDNVTRQVGLRAPQPVLGQTVNDYRRETCRMLKKAFLPRDHDLYKVNWRGLRNDALQALEPQLLTAVPVEANNPMTVPPGEFRKVEELDESGSLRIRKFIGPESFVKQMGRPGRRVVAFMRSVEPIRR